MIEDPPPLQKKKLNFKKYENISVLNDPWGVDKP